MSKVRPWKGVLLFHIYCRQQFFMRRYSDGKDSGEKGPPPAKPPQPSNHQNKVTITFPSQLHNYDEDDSTHPVPVYLRTATKTSYKVELPAKISISDIKKEVQDKTGIKNDRQILYLNGKNITDYGSIRLQPQNILHVLDSDQICTQNDSLQIKLTIVNFLSEDRTSKTKKEYSLSASDLVGDFLASIEQTMREELIVTKSEAQFHLLQSSRLLEREKSFAEQDVTKYADIVCMITEHQIKTRFSNDTKEEILHDISELLGFEDSSEPKKVEKEEKEVKLRYPRSNVYNSPEEKKKIEKPSRPIEEDDDPYGLLASRSPTLSDSIPNFKKKTTNPLAKALSLEQSPPSSHKPITKIKSSKSKKQIEQLLKFQEKSKDIFQSPTVIKQEAKESIQEEKKEQEIEQHKPAPLVLKSMPIDERRKIRLQVQKLFDFGDNGPNTSQNKEQKEQQKPKSPPTESPKPVEREKDRLRLSMGSRPIFLDQLRLPINKPSQ